MRTRTLLRSNAETLRRKRVFSKLAVVASTGGVSNLHIKAFLEMKRKKKQHVAS